MICHEKTKAKNILPSHPKVAVQMPGITMTRMTEASSHLEQQVFSLSLSRSRPTFSNLCIYIFHRVIILD